MPNRRRLKWGDPRFLESRECARNRHRFRRELFTAVPDGDRIAKAMYVGLSYYPTYLAARERFTPMDYEDCFQEAACTWVETGDFQEAVRAVRRWVWRNVIRQGKVSKEGDPEQAPSYTAKWKDKIPILTSLLLSTKIKKGSRGIQAAVKQATIVCMLADGMSLGRISRELGISYDNAKRHRQRALQTLKNFARKGKRE